MTQNIWAVGRNYANHARELGNEVPSEPIIFLKAGACLNTTAQIHLPNWPSEIHHELELALRFGSQLEPSHWTLALDLTDRRAQNEAKKNGTPWTLAKSFRGSCPIAPWQSLTPQFNLQNFQFSLQINGVVRQTGNTQDMVFTIANLVHFVKARFPVQEGDILLTGTPEGVGPLREGDHLEAFAQGQSFHRWQVNAGA